MNFALLGAFISSLIFWISASIVTIMIVTNSRKSDGIFDLSASFVNPGSMAEKASCQVGVDEACTKAATLGERLACKHKKLVDCYASKRIPDGTDLRYVSPTGAKDNCVGMVAYGTDGPFTNRTAFPVCLGPGESIEFPRGHPYRYVLRQNKSYLFKGLNDTEWFYGDKKSGYIIPDEKGTDSNGQPKYTLPNGDELPYGLTNALVSIRDKFGYNVIPIYKYKNGTLEQAYLPDVPMQISRSKYLSDDNVCEKVLPLVCQPCPKTWMYKTDCGYPIKNRADCLYQKTWDEKCAALKERSFGA